MTATNQSRWRVDALRRPLGWLALATLAALVPKCLVCLVAYAGIGAALGLPFVAPEMCGLPGGNAPHPEAWFAMVALPVAPILLWKTHRVVCRK